MPFCWAMIYKTKEVGNLTCQIFSAQWNRVKIRIKGLRQHRFLGRFASYRVSLNTHSAQGNKDNAYLKRVRILSGRILSGFYCISYVCVSGPVSGRTGELGEQYPFRVRGCFCSPPRKDGHTPSLTRGNLPARQSHRSSKSRGRKRSVSLAVISLLGWGGSLTTISLSGLQAKALIRFPATRRGGRRRARSSLLANSSAGRKRRATALRAVPTPVLHGFLAKWRTPQSKGRPNTADSNAVRKILLDRGR